MNNNLFDTKEMEALLDTLNASTINKPDSALASDNMSKEMEASQRRYEEYIKKHSEN